MGADGMILTSVLPFLHASVLNIDTESFRTDTRTHEEGQKSSACFVGEGIFRGNRDSANAATAPGDSSTVKALRVEGWVERFGWRGTEPNELFRSEFGQNSFKIQEFSLENSKISEKFNFNIV